MGRDGREDNLVALDPIKKGEVPYIEVTRAAGRALCVSHFYGRRVILVKRSGLARGQTKLVEDAAEVQCKLPASDAAMNSLSVVLMATVGCSLAR